MPATKDLRKDPDLFIDLFRKHIHEYFHTDVALTFYTNTGANINDINHEVPGQLLTLQKRDLQGIAANNAPANDGNHRQKKDNTQEAFHFAESLIKFFQHGKLCIARFPAIRSFLPK